MPTKKKKYNARFPPARIKKIMQKDEEVGKVASTVPVMLSRLLELFTESLILKTNELTLSVNARTLTTSHLKQVILSERKFDFLKDLVAHIPDVQANDEDGGDSNSDQGNRPRPRGRPRKKKEGGDLTVPKKRGRRPKAVVQLQEDMLEEDNSEDSETEDADSNENEDIESTSEDTNCDRSMETVVPQVWKRRRIDDATEATTSSFHDPDSQPRVLANYNAPTMGGENQGGSGDLLTVNSKDIIRETLPSQSSVALSLGLATNFEVPSIEQMASEACLPLNLKTGADNSLTAATKVTNPMISVAQDLETYLMQQQQELHRAVGLNFGKTSYPADGPVQVPSTLGLLVPPPAHQPISHATLRQPLTTACLMQPPFARSNLLPLTASEFVSCVNLPTAVDNTSSSLLSPVLNTNSGQAVHRMPVVPASFPGAGAVLARSTSIPHGTGVGASRPSSSSLVTSPEDDYDS